MRIVSFDIGIRNLAYCVLDGRRVDDENFESDSGINLECSILDWGVINLCEAKEKVKKVSLNTLCTRLIDRLDKIPSLHDAIDNIILENQPVYMNPKMKSVQMMLFTYFMMRGTQQVKMFSPRRKLQVYDGPPVECHLKSKYSRTKFLGIAYCKHMIRNCSLVDYFDLHKKKDDLADSFLQGVLFLQKETQTSAIQII